MVIKCVKLAKYEIKVYIDRVPSFFINNKMIFLLVGPTVTRLLHDPLAVNLLDSRLFMVAMLLLIKCYDKKYRIQLWWLGLLER